MTTDKLIATYHDVYFYFELYEDYIQIHQENRIVIPYQGVIKNNGTKIYFNDLKGIYFYKELVNFEDVPTQKNKVGWLHKCELKSKDTTFKPIKNIVHGDQLKNQTDKTPEYKEFIKLLMEKALPHQPKIYTASGLTSRIDKALPFLKLNKLTPLKFTGLVIITFFFIEFLDKLLGYLDIETWILYAVGFSGYVITVLSYILDKFWKKKITWEEVEKELLPQKTE